LGDGAEFVRGLRQCNVECLFASPRAFEQELEPESRFSRSGVALYEIEPAAGETPGENVVETGNAGDNLWR
jgi:hypothetical protein